MSTARRNQSEVGAPATPAPSHPGNDPGRRAPRCRPQTLPVPPAGFPTRTIGLSGVRSGGFMARAETSALTPNRTG